MDGANADDLEASARSLAESLRKAGNKNHRRYDLVIVDGRLMVVRDEICRAVDEALNEAFGTQPEPDNTHGTFLS